MTRRKILVAALALANMTLLSQPAFGQMAGGVIKIGVLTDMASIYSPWAGKGSVVAAQMAADDFRRAIPNVSFKIDIVQADFQVKPDVAVAISRKWAAEGVNAIVDLTTSGTALAVKDALKNGPVSILVTGAMSDDLTTTECAANSVHWAFDATSVNVPPMKAYLELGLKKYFFVTVEGAGGKATEDAVRKVVVENGGTVVGGVRTPINANDFSSFLLQAQASKADVIVLLQSGADLVAALKQADEFGLRNSGQRVHVGTFKITEVEGIGLKLAQGLRYTDAFFHDANEGTRAFSKRFAEQMQGQMPSSNHAAIYSVVSHYLKAAHQANSSDARVLVPKMKELPVTDPLYGPGKLRADGRMVHDMYIFEIKKPTESKSRWDLLKMVETIPGDKAFRPMSKACPLVKD